MNILYTLNTIKKAHNAESGIKWIFSYIIELTDKLFAFQDLSNDILEFD